MNTRPTPETDALWGAYYDDMLPNGQFRYGPRDLKNHACDLESERDEARERLTGIEIVMRAELGGHPDSELWGDAGLIAATMRCVDALGEVTEQRDEAREELATMTAQRDRLAEEIDKLESHIATVKKCHDWTAADRDAVARQRDRLAEALEKVIRCHHDQPCTAIVLQQDDEIKRMRDALQSLTPNEL
jgi:hypothetical protein